jgi:propanol-preferring alcohol dehydrogenase
MEQWRPTMRAARYVGPGGGLVLATVPVPEPGPGEVLLRVLAAGLCHTELQLLAGTLNLGVTPLTLGHEVVGEVVALGERVEAVQAGQRVLVYYYNPCDECGWCASGQEQLCPNLGPQIGFSADGGFAEYVRVKARNLFPLPPGLDSGEAAPLGCSAAAALHAVRAVAEVRPGETVLVYGIGAVGLALVQLARLAGARVLAVGRSPAKLALARELGAEVVGAGGGSEVVAEALRATRSEGADVVFEVVGSAETMANSIALLRRHGRLVFVGYGADRLQLNPLHLVLKELQVRGSLGNTRQELGAVIDLAAEGKLRSVVSCQQPLGAVNQALEALRRGEVVGRIILLPGARAQRARTEPRDVMAAPAGPDHPGASSPTGPTSPTAQTGSTGLAADSPPEPAGLMAHTSTGPAPAATDSRTAAGRTPATQSAAASRSGNGRSPVSAAAPGSPGAPDGRSSSDFPLEPELLAFVGRGLEAPQNDDAFNDLALRLFAYQFQHNAPYRAFAARRGRTPETVAHWLEIPPVPIGGFKETLLVCEPIEAAREFNSSGTTRPEHKSRHFHPSLTLYDRNATLNFEAHVLPDEARLPMLVLFPPPDQLPNSSLAYWLELMARCFGADGGRWFVGQAGLDGPALAAALAQADRAGQPVCLLAASFSLVHFLDFCDAESLRFRLPPGSRLMDTGGYKGRSRELSQAELYRLAGERLGLEETHLISMYGMTEHSTQFLDAVLRNQVQGRPGPRYKTVPPWARTLVLDPDSLQPQPPGQPGLLCHYDLANRASVLAVLSEDLGFTVGEGFELIGRAQGTEARGCSIAVDELILAARSQA